jgi:ABC-2 type transport system permease protein
MNRFIWLIRRELWEHRAIWIAPAVVLALLALVAATGNINLGDVDVDSAQKISELPPEKREELRADIEKQFGDRTDEAMARIEKGDGGTLMTLLPDDKRTAIVALIYSMLGVLMFLVLGTIAAFYSLDALYADRRDRSVLFWKSLPLSDAETVLAKFTVAAVVIPVIALGATLLAQFVVATGGSIKLALTGGPAAMMWDPQALLAGGTSAALIAIVSVLWYSPLVAYLLLASAWAPKAPFLWGVVPPVAGVVLERIATGSDYLGDFLVWRLFGPFKALGGDDSNMPAVVIDSDNLPGTAGAIADRFVEFIASPGMFVGLLVGAALIGAAISLRRYRDETI